jgi:cyclic beta-1,2-glucan synthetase
MAGAVLGRLVPQAPAELLDILDADRGALEAPIRAEVFGPERFGEHGRRLAASQRAQRARSPALTFSPRLHDNIAALREAHRFIGLQASTGYEVSPAAEWLLDNFHLIEAQLVEIQGGLPRSYFRALPVLVDEPLAGLPRVYGVAWAFVAHTDGRFDDELLVHFLACYQRERELNLGELWALPTTLRVVLVENLRRLAERVAAHKAARELANLCGDHIERYGTDALDQLLGLLDRRGVGRAFLAQLGQRLQERTAEPKPEAGQALAWLARVLPDPAAAQAQQSADQAADNLSVSNAVTSLREIGDADWTEIVATSSPLMQAMLASPLFEAESAVTRDQTLHAIEAWARRSGRSELQVAQALLALLQAAPDDAASPLDEPRVAEHWLRGHGRPALAAALGMSPDGSLPYAWTQRWRSAALPVYLAVLVLGTLGLVGGLLWHAQGTGEAPWWAWTACAMLMLFPASEAVVAVIHRLSSESLRPRLLPRLAFAHGIPVEHRPMVVVPAMLTSPATIDELVRRLELHHLANPERHAQFALLSDWADADHEKVAGDEALLDAARVRVEALNQRHPALPGALPRFLLLHRRRRFSTSEGRWIGWERKRGKLEQLVQALAEGDLGDFIDLGECSRIAPGTRYLITLDSDTRLPPGRLRELVGIAAHPQNHPRVDAERRRVVGGYGILQPRVATPLPAPREFTWFHWLFAGQCGIDPYSAASSEVYQDVFGEGTFTGKGLLHVQALHAVLAGRLPEGRVLSHDLLEGSIARCAAVTDVALVEDAPFHADVAASRVHRWTRGDWQLLPFLLHARRYGIRAINRWKMFDNLRRSLVAPASLALLVLVLAQPTIGVAVALGLVFAAFAAGPLMGAVAGFSPSRDDIATRHFYRQAGADGLRALLGGTWHLALLPAQVLASLDAIARALWRMAVSRRLLLQWTTAAQAQAQATLDAALLWRRHWRTPALAALGVVLLLAGGTAHPLAVLGLGLVWAATPWWIGLASRPRPQAGEQPLPPAERARLEAVARETWGLFERCVTAEEHHLPPDNLQTAPFDAVAHRTSPTNIGLYLLSTACARAFGWIDTAAMQARLAATLDTLERLPRYRGHFLNWYDTLTAEPLLPMYVSTVDSGNLSGHLLAVAQACRERVAEEGAPAAGLVGLAERCERLAWQPDYAFLYHRKRHLLHIGFRVAEQQLDAGFYDLLASESRLTSLLAIAKGDVPVGHWAALGRPFFAVGTRVGLRSWSGSMFEYLMPGLVLDEPRGSALCGAAAAAVCEQIAYGAERGVPWGISECAYAGRDHTLAYQYGPQGVPRLGLRRAPLDELVIAPYATLLAAPIAPVPVLRNLDALDALGARGDYGYLEALDFTPGRQPDDSPVARVHTYMAHHQGMSIVALANLLLDGPARRWCMADPHVEAVSTLLHEPPPREVSRLSAPPAGPSARDRRRSPGLLREVVPGAAALQPTHLLSNGRYAVALRANGAGWSRLSGTGITRWRDDALRDPHGSFFWLRWDRQPRPVSLTQHPSPDPAASYRASFHADRVCFDAAWAELQAHVTVWVSPEDDVEFRQVELRNLGERTLELELMSAFEPTLADPRADEAHPAFAKLFLGAEWLPAARALRFERRPRLATERAVQAAHFLAESEPGAVRLRVQTDRLAWAGRNQDPSQPRAAFGPLPAETEGALRLDTGLDPVCALSATLRLAPHAKARLTFATAASDDAGVLRAVIDKYRQPSHVQRASLMSATLAGIRLRELRISPGNHAAAQTLASALAQQLTRTHLAAPAVSPPPACDRRLLWRFGISGDRPIVLVSAGVAQGLGMVRALAQALRLWAWGGLPCDLVVVNAESASYQMAFHREIAALRDRHLAETAATPGAAGAHGTGFHLLKADEVSSDELSTLQVLARVHLVADGRPLQHHVAAWAEQHERAAEQREAESVASLPHAPAGSTAPAVSTGAFSADGARFAFDAGVLTRPARPWINVLSNRGFGAQISEGGGGYTWAVNSRMNQLTGWSNDAVGDPPSEWFLLQDRHSRRCWSVTAGPGADERAVYRVTHGQGRTEVVHRSGEAEVSVAWCVDAEAAVKQVVVTVANHGSWALEWRLAALAEWVMGQGRADRGSTHTAVLRQRLPGGRLLALSCTQRDRAGGFGGGTAFLAVAAPEGGGGDEDWTCDRRECFDARGRLVLPDLLGRRAGAGLDPCAALSVPLDVAPGATETRVLLLGWADTPEAAHELATRAALVDPAQRQQAVQARWDALLGAAEVRTPDPLLDAMVNRWLLYQAVSSRLWAKAGFYQAGGATGFRDQLQDAMALAWAAPAMLREQIALCASRQFPEGDVQHWWHAPGGAGVRTHFSDDLLWLPWACARWLQVTGDASLFDEEVPFLEAPPIPEGAEDAYTTPEVSAETASVYEHAARTIDRSLRSGAHGLPLMGTGDWNDGMNRVGHEGRGESVWLGWFLCRVVADFVPIARARGDGERAQRWEEAAEGWREALATEAWDGAWFKRAFFDDGSPLGSQANTEGRIDLIAQAWAVLSGAASVEQQRQALAAVETHLVDTDAGLLRLLDPPLQQAEPSAGYIQAYPPGIRENGGQYSHAGVWALMARAAWEAALPEAEAPSTGGDVVYRDFTWLSPAHRAVHPRYGAAYGIEPYVMAGDVYSRPPYTGRGGWSWYTGAAAWLHRAAIESLFGLRLGPEWLSLCPCLPSHWSWAELVLRRDGRVLRLLLARTSAAGATDTAAPWQPPAGARVLLRGEALRWVDVEGEACWVVPLLEAPGQPAQGQHGRAPAEGSVPLAAG